MTLGNTVVIEVSVILPVYNERENLAALLEEIDQALAGRSYEIVAVDDGSIDGSFEELQRLRRHHRRLRIVALATNAGQSAAFAVGFGFSTGDLILTLDADGQNPPAEGRKLLAALEAWEDYDAAIGYRVRRRDSRWKRFQAQVATLVRTAVIGDRVRDIGCSLRAIRRSALRDVPEFDGMHRFLPTLIRIAGGRVLEVPVEHRARRWGRSKYGMWNRAVRGLKDALGVRWLKQRALRYEIREEIG